MILGIELGSTRIKSVLINPAGEVLAQGAFEWENQLKDGLWTYDLEADEWYAEYHGDSFDFESDLRYTKKCVRNGLRFWQSEDPDRFLEKDDDEEGGEV